MKCLKWLSVGTIVSSLCLLLSSIDSEAGVSVNTAGKTHIGTFEGSTTFTTSSSNGINPGLFIEVRDADGNFKQYTSEDGVITVPNTKEGAYVTQAKLLGKTKYVDQDTGEILDEWEEGRNLKLESSKMPVLTTSNEDGTKTNILTVNEDVELRGIYNYGFGDYVNVREVNDKLDLISGKFVRHIGEVTLDGSDDEGYVDNWNEEAYYIGAVNENFERRSVVYSAELPFTGYTKENYPSLMNSGGMGLFLSLPKTYTNGTQSTAELRKWLAKNPVTIQYILETESVKTVDLTSTHQFNLISDSVVQIKGEALPTIYSITVPSEPLTFAINPNSEEGQQFIAPDFSITNESKGPVFLELKSFEQTTNVFNDVLPDEHEDWVQLTKDESKDIALALVPKSSDSWLTLNEGPKYVANTENIELGGIKAGATVDFSFDAYHGRVFDQNLFPEYRLVFTFGF